MTPSSERFAERTRRFKKEGVPQSTINFQEICAILDRLDAQDQELSTISKVIDIIIKRLDKLEYPMYVVNGNEIRRLTPEEERERKPNPSDPEQL